MDNGTLAHHGIKGMKWGVRRTPAQLGHGPGRKRIVRRSGLQKSAGRTGSAAGAKRPGTETKSAPKKTFREMSDEELREAISRLELEKKYKDLSRPAEQAKVDRGKKFVMDVLEKSGTNIANQVATYAMGALVNQLAGKEIVNPKKGQKDK